MKIYLTFVFSILILSLYLKTSKNSCKKTSFRYNTILILIFFIIFIFSAFRYNVGYDYKAYAIRIDEMFQYRLFFIVKELFSNGIMIIANVLNNKQIFFATNSFITTILVLKSIEMESSDFTLSLWVYLTFPMFFHNSLSVVRFFTSLSIVLYSTQYIYQRNIKRFILLISLAFLFHNSALIALPLYFLYGRKINYKILSLIIIPFKLFEKNIMSLLSIILPGLSKYFQLDNVTSGRFTLIVLILILLVSLWVRNYLSTDTKKINFYINSLFLGVIFYLLFYNVGTIAYRASLYYYIYIIYLIPYIVDSLSSVFTSFTGLNMKNSLIMFNVLSIIAFLSMFIYILYVSANGYIPYDFRWVV